VVVSVREGDRVRGEEVISFSHPETLPQLPSPKERAAEPLPALPGPAAYALEVSQGGGFAVRIGTQLYPVESSFSFPNGGENRLVVGATPDVAGEKEWTVKTEKLTANGAYRIIAEGKHYRITRELTPQPSRVLVKDHIENLTEADLGLALDNRVDARDKGDVNLQALAAPIPGDVPWSVKSCG
jgi:hypothetical protein